MLFCRVILFIAQAHKLARYLTSITIPVKWSLDTLTFDYSVFHLCLKRKQEEEGFKMLGGPVNKICIHQHQTVQTSKTVCFSQALNVNFDATGTPSF